MAAADYTRKVDADAVRWDRVDGLGLTGSAMTTMPPLAEPAGPPPSLEYRFWLARGGRADVVVTVSPTQAFVPGRGLRYAIAVDDQPRQTVDTIADRGRAAWERSVADACRRCTTGLGTLAAGYHTLRLTMVDPAIVVQHLTVDLGGLRTSYLGPPESFHCQTRGTP